ncbi:MAG: hypothetical protein LPK00_07595 [Bacillaceae bacterium]|nr:hypothetical protein [Bacillaceae bacterium]
MGRYRNSNANQQAVAGLQDNLVTPFTRNNQVVNVNNITIKIDAATFAKAKQDQAQAQAQLDNLF